MSHSKLSGVKFVVTPVSQHDCRHVAIPDAFQGNLELNGPEMYAKTRVSLTAGQHPGSCGPGPEHPRLYL